MPIHDWTRVDAGLYHNFHQDWTIEINRALNRGVLPAGYLALTDLKVEGYEPDVVAIRGDVFPDAQLFIAPGRYVNAPLEEIYATVWAVTPQLIRDRVASPGAA